MIKCSRCGEEFAPSFIIEGVKRRLDGRKSCLKCVPYGTGNRKPIRIDQISVFCLNCGKPIARKNNRYCSYSCQKSKQKSDYIGRWLCGVEDGVTCGINSGEQTSLTIINWLKETRGEKCERCGWNEQNKFTGKIPVQVHHEDGDVRNNRPNNLTLICPSCHSLTEHFGGRNKGNGRNGRHNLRQ